MENENLILMARICLHNKVEPSFILSLQKFGLIKIFELKKKLYLAQDEISKLERIIRLHYDLGINFEGIDAIVGLLQQIEVLQRDLLRTKNRLEIFAP